MRDRFSGFVHIALIALAAFAVAFLSTRVGFGLGYKTPTMFIEGFAKQRLRSVVLMESVVHRRQVVLPGASRALVRTSVVIYPLTIYSPWI